MGLKANFFSLRQLGSGASELGGNNSQANRDATPYSR